ncbi:MAG: pilus assembly protein N-terminal domain-containing protein [Candidatus Eremiobacteraeota bacterium]|nr:pilus assembly protein N-terminal domain-containing protein [Candidatus Eremiobacteraeota bacterium]
MVKHRATATRLAALLFATALTAGGLIPARAADVTFLSLNSGHSIVVPVPGLSRVAVGDGTIAGVIPIGTTQLVINAKLPGHTSVYVWAGKRRLEYEVSVTSSSVDEVSQVLRAALPYRNVSVMTLGHNVLVRGTVADMQQFIDLGELLTRFNGTLVSRSGKDSGENGKIINAVTVAHSLGSIQNEFKHEPGVIGLQIEPDDKGNIMVSGRVHNRIQAEQVLTRAKTLAGPYLAADGKMLDRLEVATTSQVGIKVYVLEVDRTALNQLGIRLQSATPDDPLFPQHYSIGQPSFPVVEGRGPNLAGGPFFRTTYLAPTLDLIMQTGHARILSSPNLVTMPGGEATFLVGGQIPYIYSSGLGQVSVEFKNYGVQLKILPKILPDGSIDTKISPDISNLDYQNAVQLNGFFIPALKESTLSTELITRDGQSVIMGGLLNRMEQRTILKIPLLSQLPILGKLFRSTRYQTGETDVVFVMTPQIITQ